MRRCSWLLTVLKFPRVYLCYSDLHRQWYEGECPHLVALGDPSI